MAKTASTMIPLGTLAPDFTLPAADTDSNMTLRQLAGDSGTLLMFICNHCPFVIHIERGLVTLAEDYQGKGISIVAINSNDANAYPEDGPAAMAAKAYPFPYLFDESQQVAKAYDAACTPDLFLFNNELRCVYRGQFDDSRPGNGIAVSGASIRAAMEALLTGQPPLADQQASVGCSIKWKRR